MESEFPTNSYSQKSEKPEKREPKKVERVTTGEAIHRKRSVGKRLKETLIGGNFRTARDYVAMDVLIPAIKNAVADAVSQGIEQMMFGEVRSTSRRTGNRPGGLNGFINYSRYSPNTPRDNRREEPRHNISRRARSSHDFGEIILPTRVEAEEVIDRLFDLVSKFEMATVADLYELVGVSGNHTDVNYGWTDLRSSGITRVRNGYLLDLPPTELID